MSKEKEKREKKISFYIQGFLLFYAAIIGLIAGIAGNHGLHYVLSTSLREMLHSPFSFGFFL
jgi:hypothetical protein